MKAIVLDAVIMDVRSWRVTGYAIGRPIDTRLAIAALKRAIALPAGQCFVGSMNWDLGPIRG